jgi:hypothetical protein
MHGRMFKKELDSDDLLQQDPAELGGIDGHPTPEQRADFVVKRLEQFIRDNRTVDEGMSFKQWTDMARTEIAITIADAETSYQDDDVVSNRLVISAAASLITIGIWGTLLAFDKAQHLVVAIICVIAGMWLAAVAGEWRFRKFFRMREAKKRAKSLRRVEDLNRRIKRMEKQLEKDVKEIEETVSAMVKTKAKAARSDTQNTMLSTIKDFREKMGMSG